MSGLDDWLNEKPEPVVKDDRTPTSESFWRRINWSNWLLIGLVAFLLVSNRVDCDRGVSPDDGDAVVIDDATNAVLMLQDKSEVGQSKLTPGQKQTLNAQPITAAIENMGYQVRIQSKDDDFDGMEPIWGKLESLANESPSMTVAKDGRVVSFELPEADQVKSKLESIK